MQEAAIIGVEERLDRDRVRGVADRVEAALRAGDARVVVDLTGVEKFDSAGLAALVDGMRRARQRGVDLRLRGVSEPMREFFSLVSLERLLGPGPKVEPMDPISTAGAAVEPLWEGTRAVAALGLRVAHALVVGPWRGRPVRLDRTVAELDHAANGALPIVTLISFLLGLVLAMQAYVQLRVWGADIYMADMVGVSVVTEIGPLMTAIVLAARSGGSNAAQLGSMVIGEEIDALRQMGVHPVRFLVVPKVLALGMATLFLGLLFDAVAMCGGALFAFAIAGIEPGAYQEQTRQALELSEFLIGLLKCVVFGTCVGVVGCALGLRVRGGSEGVARATTNAVVSSIFLIIVVDAVFVTVQRMLLG